MEDRNYVFAYFTGETEQGEQVYFSVSKDGLRWVDINGQKPVLISTVGERGIRDPFLLRSETDGQYYLLGTDLRIAGGCGWDAARSAGSTQLVIWTSEDMIHWSEPWTYPVGIPGAGCAWAPEAVYDRKRDAYLVFWASCVEEKQIIYSSYTRDFRHFTKSRKYMEYSYEVIDTTIVEADGKYYRFYKDETEKYIRVDCGTDLQGDFEEIQSETLKGMTGVEGAIVYPLKGGDWCLLVDQFAIGGGYLPLRCKDLASGEFSVIPEEEYDMGKMLKRHGSVLQLDDNTWRSLKV